MGLARSRLAALALCGLTAALPGASRAAGVPVAVAAHFTQDDSGAELAFDVSASVSGEAYGLDAPDRIVVDLPEVNFRIDPSIGRSAALKDGGFVKAYRFGVVTPGRSRVIFDLDRPACPGAVDSKPIAEGAPAARLTIQLKPCDDAAFAAIRRAPEAASASPAPFR